MELKDIAAVIKELILPELKEIRYEQTEIKTALTLTNKRLDDVNTHLADQSRRIDAVRDKLAGRIDETNKRIDSVREELADRIDAVREELSRRIDETNKRIDENNRRIESVQAELSTRLEAIHHDVILRIDKTNDRLNRLYEVIVRRDDHEELRTRVDRLEHEMAVLKQRFAA